MPPHISKKAMAAEVVRLRAELDRVRRSEQAALQRLAAAEEISRRAWTADLDSWQRRRQTPDK